MTKGEQIQKVKEILKEHGIRLYTEACDCPGSPVVAFEYRGEMILDYEDGAKIDMFEEEQ